MHYDGYGVIEALRDGRMLTLTMSRPGTMNAVDAVLHEELWRIFYDVAADPIPTCIGPGAKPKYEPMPFHDFFVTCRVDGTYIHWTADTDKD